MHGLHLTQAKAIVLDVVSLLEDDALRAVTDLVKTPRKYTPEGIWPSGCSLNAFHLEVCWAPPIGVLQVGGQHLEQQRVRKTPGGLQDGSSDFRRFGSPLDLRLPQRLSCPSCKV